MNITDIHKYQFSNICSALINFINLLTNLSLNVHLTETSQLFS
jgi:hypothetical protein